MVRVTIIDNEKVLKSLLTDVNNNTLVAWAQEGERSPGFSVFTTLGEIKEVNCKEDDIFELLVRAALNSLDLRGVEIGFSTNETLFSSLIKLGFEIKGSKAEVNIKNFFKPCCNGCN